MGHGRPPWTGPRVPAGRSRSEEPIGSARSTIPLPRQPAPPADYDPVSSSATGPCPARPPRWQGVRDRPWARPPIEPQAHGLGHRRFRVPCPVASEPSSCPRPPARFLARISPRAICRNSPMNDTTGGSPEIPKRHDFFVGIDSDGCVFDTMEVKHKECFIPNIIQFFEPGRGLQVRPRGRRVRQPLFAVAGDQSLPRPGADPRPPGRSARGRPPWVPACRACRASGRGSSARRSSATPTLRAEVERTDDPDLVVTLEWSEAVNRAIGEIVHDVPPFPFVRESLAAIDGRADVMVCSATPGEALEREWPEHGLAGHVALIAGQERGSKKDAPGPGRRRPLRPRQDPHGRRRPRRPRAPPRPTASSSSRSTPASRTNPGAASTTRPSPGSSPAPTPPTTWPTRSPASRPSCPRSRPGRIGLRMRPGSITGHPRRWKESWHGHRP